MSERPHGCMIDWAFALKRRWHWTKYPSTAVMALVFLVVVPVVMLLRGIGLAGDLMAKAFGLSEWWD